jgi:hypothetical protein
MQHSTHDLLRVPPTRPAGKTRWDGYRTCSMTTVVNVLSCRRKEGQDTRLLALSHLPINMGPQALPLRFPLEETLGALRRIPRLRHAAPACARDSWIRETPYACRTAPGDGPRPGRRERISPPATSPKRSSCTIRSSSKRSKTMPVARYFRLGERVGQRPARSYGESP